MKVLGVYDKNSDVRCFGRNIFLVMDQFLKNYPCEYGKCYYDNLETLKLIKVDKFMEDNLAGKYNQDGNVIIFNKSDALGHELFHMASYDRERHIMAFDGHMDIEKGLIEGMTEYLFNKAYSRGSVSGYGFEVFCVSMLDDMDNLFKGYFMTNHDEFINVFPNKRCIYSLMYALNIYHNESMSYISLPEDDEDILEKIQEAIRGVINSLITIELSRKMDSDNLIKYGDKFMDLVTSKEISDIMYWLYPKYNNYASRQINRRIRKMV